LARKCNYLISMAPGTLSRVAMLPDLCIVKIMGDVIDRLRHELRAWLRDVFDVWVDLWEHNSLAWSSSSMEDSELDSELDSEDLRGGY